ncbi:MAG: BamA/TamA family outer membrane protein [Acidobacteriota bacterium]|nr:BamA/TamA family outer membrane protein [Acidobacteriota bacterium]
MGTSAHGQTGLQTGLQTGPQAAAAAPSPPATLWSLQGVPVLAIQFEGVTYAPGDRLPNELSQRAGEPLDADKVRESERRLFASGRYRDLAVYSVRSANGITLVFAGKMRMFVGRVSIAGVKSDRLSSLLQFATRLEPGAALREGDLQSGVDGIRQALQQNGYYEPSISIATQDDVAGEQTNVTYTVAIGPQAKIGVIQVQGKDPGLTVAELRRTGKLKTGSRMTRETTSNVLTRLRTFYQKKDHLEATVTLEQQVYDAARKRVDLMFQANQGPQVTVAVEGISLSKDRLHLLVPIFQEGTIDNDLLNEGVHNLREYEQQRGYFDAHVEVHVTGQGSSTEHVVYTVERGPRHKVLEVAISGNKYFDTDLLRERLKVQRANPYLPSGSYSQSLVNADVSSIQALYRSNGFDEAKVTTRVEDVDVVRGKTLKEAQIRVSYLIEEGPQKLFGKVMLNGVAQERRQELEASLNARPGQPFSLSTLVGDRDALLGYYVSHGFDQARVEVEQHSSPDDATRTDVALDVTEGPQVFVRDVLVSGRERVRYGVVNRQLLVHHGDPLDQAALLETQRNLYSLALFNDVIAKVQNPNGDAPQKNVVLQLTEAKRWDVTYGFGLEAQTGTPTSGTISEASRIQLGLPPTAQYSQNGKAGVSPRVSLDVTRINLRGTEDLLTLHTTYGLLEKVATLTLQNPHIHGWKGLTGAVSGGYSNIQDITTFASSTLQFDARLTEKIKRAETLIYDFQYRLVKVDPNSLQVSANLIPLLSQPVRVGGPGVTWLRDTRQPGPLNAVKGSYTSLQEFLASSRFGSQVDFNRVDLTNSTYYQFGKQHYVLARETRFGFETAYGTNPNVGNTECAGVLLTTNPSCTAVPLPERLYAGGANSLRGFGINAAGPRDLQTGYPVGGTAVFVNSLELRLPAPTLPYVGNSVNFVLFHDMGNVFQNESDLWPSLARVRQPLKSTCTDVSGSIGTCSFNYSSHTVGLGARYRTPVGPVRVDFSYNLNPPIYPVIYDFNNSLPHVGAANHFNFFFSIGESF